MKKKLRSPKDDIVTEFATKLEALKERHNKEMADIRMEYARRLSCWDVQIGDIINCGKHLFQVQGIRAMCAPQLLYYGPAVRRTDHKPLTRGAHNACCYDSEILTVTKPKKQAS